MQLPQLSTVPSNVVYSNALFKCDLRIRQVAVASESCHESILPAAVLKFFGECENMWKLESRQHRCHYQTPLLSNGVI